MVPHEARPDRVDPSRDELARVDPPLGYRALLVAFPRGACSGSARMVFVDEAGTYVGAVGPGEAALLVAPETNDRIRMLSSVDVTAPFGAWFTLDEIHLGPTSSGVLLGSPRVDGRRCGSGQYADARVVTKSEMEDALASAELRWLDPRLDDGKAWLASNRTRVAEMLADRTTTPGSPAPSQVLRYTRVP